MMKIMRMIFLGIAFLPLLTNAMYGNNPETEGMVTENGMGQPATQGGLSSLLRGNNDNPPFSVAPGAGQPEGENANNDEGSSASASASASSSQGSASGLSEESSETGAAPGETGAAPNTNKNPCVKMTISYGPSGGAKTSGDVIAELLPTDAPATVENFLSYVDSKYFDGTIFHRVIKDFMIQGGGFTPELYSGTDSQKPGEKPPIKDEAKLPNDKGTLSMARTSDPDSATSQFFINTNDNDSLNKAEGNDGYAVFGRVLSGMDEVVMQIQNLPTGHVSGMDDVPESPVAIDMIRKVQCPPQ